MEVELGGLEEAVFEIVQVEEHAVLVEGRLRIAGFPVHARGAVDLDGGQSADGALQQLLLLEIIASAGLAPAFDGVEQRAVAEVALQVAHLVVADGQQPWHWQMALVEMAADGDEGMILIAARTDDTNHRTAVGTGQTVVLTVATSPRNLLYMSRFLPRPVFI